jgi:hypothetical protein
MRELFTEQSMEIVTSVTKSEWNTIQVALSIRDEIGSGHRPSCPNCGQCPINADKTVG